jgi:predicted DNA-binding ribbon-helix-helix protein
MDDMGNLRMTKRSIYYDDNNLKSNLRISNLAYLMQDPRGNEPMNACNLISPYR